MGEERSGLLSEQALCGRRAIGPSHVEILYHGVGLHARGWKAALGVVMQVDDVVAPFGAGTGALKEIQALLDQGCIGVPLGVVKLGQKRIRVGKGSEHLLAPFVQDVALRGAFCFGSHAGEILARQPGGDEEFVQSFGRGGLGEPGLELLV